MGQEQSLPQDTNETDNNNNINNINNINNNSNIEENNNREKNNDNNNDNLNSKENDSELESPNKSINENNSEIENSVQFKGLSNTTLNDNYKNPMVSVNSIIKSYKSSKDFFSLNILESLLNISSTKIYPPNHEIWNNLLKKEKIPKISTRQASFDMNVVINFIGTEMAINNETTRNFCRLVINLISELNSLKEQEYKKDVNVEIRNALYIIKLYSKYFIENMEVDKIKNLFDDYEPSEIIKDTQDDNENNNIILLMNKEIIDNKKSKLEILIKELLNTLIYLPHSNEKNVELYEEILNTFIAFFASRFHNDMEKQDNYILITTFKVLSEQENENLAGKVITKLLLNLIYENDQKEGLFARVLRKNSTSLSSIAKKSLYIFLILTNQPNQLAKNELSNLVNELTNIQETDVIPQSNPPNLKISFQSLYSLINNKICDNEEICLLLYQLISQSDAFRSFVLSKIEPELLLLPLLQTFYTSFKEKINFNKIYTILITLLIMSQDEVYTETLQRIEINQPSWFLENNLKKISLSNFTFLICLRVIQINLGKYKDIYLHSNCLAIITNLAIKMDNIHYYVAHKLMNLLDLIQKKYFKLKNLNADNEENMELQINEDLIMLILEIINSCLNNSLKTNLQLVYSVMLGKETFENLNNVEIFKEPVENIIYTINFFESKIVFEEDLPSSDEIMKQIVDLSKIWIPNKLKKTEIVKFKFEEEKDYSKFFLPYIYNMIYSNTIFFNN